MNKGENVFLSNLSLIAWIEEGGGVGTRWPYHWTAFSYSIHGRKSSFVVLDKKTVVVLINLWWHWKKKHNQSISITLKRNDWIFLICANEDHVQRTHLDFRSRYCDKDRRQHFYRHLNNLYSFKLCICFLGGGDLWWLDFLRGLPVMKYILGVFMVFLFVVVSWIVLLGVPWRERERARGENKEDAKVFLWYECRRPYLEFVFLWCPSRNAVSQVGMQGQIPCVMGNRFKAILKRERLFCCSFEYFLANAAL